MDKIGYQDQIFFAYTVRDASLTLLHLLNFRHHNQNWGIAILLWNRNNVNYCYLHQLTFKMGLLLKSTTVTKIYSSFVVFMFPIAVQVTYRISWWHVLSLRHTWQLLLVTFFDKTQSVFDGRTGNHAFWNSDIDLRKASKMRYIFLFNMHKLPSAPGHVCRHITWA